MTDEEYDNFHGERNKRSLRDFFDEGTIMNHQSCPDENPYWEETKKIYNEQPPKLQKTYRLTTIYYQKLKEEHKELLYKAEEKGRKSAENGVGTTDGNQDSITSVDRVTRKRSASIKDDKKVKAKQTKGPVTKKRKMDPAYEKRKAELKNLLEGNTNSDSNSDSDFRDVKPTASTASVDVPQGPLLQLPTGSAKVYTRLSADQKKVWKGPYRKERMNIVLFFHKALKDVLGDPHTLDIECQEPYLIFPVLKAVSVNEIQITKRDFTDVISKKEVKGGEFVLRESLGVVQCHRVDENKLKRFPATFWAHFVWRFCLNIGDSGMYNAITDDKLSFLYGIDMEEYRNKVTENDLVGYLFSKTPAKPYVKEIWSCLGNNKTKLEKIVNKPVNYAGLDSLAQKYNVFYDRTLFIERIKLVRHAMLRLRAVI